GKRNKPGLSSLSASTRSLRKPFSLPFHVSVGKREICSRSTGPSDVRNIRSEAFGSSFGEVRTISYFFHSLESIASSFRSKGSLLASINSILIFCPAALPDRAQTEKRYVASFFTPIPRKP